MSLVKLTGEEELIRLIKLLSDRGYRLIGPVLQDDVILYKEVGKDYRFPKGLREVQGKGYYRVFTNGKGYFNYVHGFYSPKHFLHPPVETLLKVEPSLKQNTVIESEPLALIGIRACDIKALSILDDVFVNKNRHPDEHYKRKRESIFIVGVNCVYTGDTCFCGTMGTGPFIEEGYDISITEIEEGFLIRAGSERGKEIVEQLMGEEAGEKHLKKEKDLIEKAREKTKLDLDTNDLHKKLLSKLESPLWDDIEKRCLACGSCTMVCPTCFCYEVRDEITLDGTSSTRIRSWDVCFREGFSAIHGIPIRSTIKARYRQWLMHKFSYWVYQFGTYGCVGCGRCITWCPVGIDIREEVRKLAS